MIANLPPFYQMPWSKKDGSLTTEAFLYNDELAQTLNALVVLVNSLSLSAFSKTNGGGSSAITHQGLILPKRSSIEIALLEPSAPVGTLWFDTDLKKVTVKTQTGMTEVMPSN